MSEDDPLETLVRMWRELRLVDPTDQEREARRRLDEINASGISDRDLILAASRLSGRLIEFVAESTGGSVDAALEAVLRVLLEE